MNGNIRPDTMERITTQALAEAFIAEQVTSLKEQIGDGKVLLALSGGVDSSVVAALLIKAIGKQLVCVHVNHGLLRKGEPEQVVSVFRDKLKAELVYVDAVDRFLGKLAGVADPEQKRKIIGAEFIDVFADEARKLMKQADPQMSADDIWWKVDQISWQKETGAEKTPGGKNYRLMQAVAGNKSEEITRVVKEMMAHGVTQKQIKDYMGDLKQEYLAADSKEKVRIRDAIQKVYKAIGLTAAEADKRIKKWK